jgi:hypothetical protein
MRLSTFMRRAAYALVAVVVLPAAAGAGVAECPPGQAALTGPAGGIICVDLPPVPEGPWLEMPDVPEALEMPEIPALPVAVCMPPYILPGEDGSCSWSCAPGTRPDSGSGECVCLDGLAEAGFDADGRRVCTRDPSVTIQARAETRLMLPPKAPVPQSIPSTREP